MPACLRCVKCLFFLLLVGTSLPAVARGQCISFTEAEKHIGANKCVTGKVLYVKQGNRGVHFLISALTIELVPSRWWCFPSDLKQIGDIRQLQGKQIEIEGEVKGYDGRAEIVLRRLSQLRGDAGRIPPLPKEYDVERHGKYSAGKFSHPKTAKNPSRKKQSAPVSLEDPSSPMSSTD